jgi:NaMN:DMB phosphoribosyltransferase
VVREGVGAGEEMTQALYAHMNNKKIKIKKNRYGILQNAFCK